jgi:uncharacterized protein YdaU (DUF1376 family)
MKDKKDKIYYFQEKSNDILDLQDELTTEEIGIYFILKAGYFKYSGELTKENIYQRCKFFGDKIKMDSMISKLFDLQDGLLVNSNWLSEINSIKQLSEKRKQIAEKRWNEEGLKQKGSKSEAKRKQKEPKKPSGLFGNPKEPKETLNDNVNKDDNVNEYDNVNNNFNIMENHKIKTKKFIKPTIQEIKDYCLERNNIVNVEKFFNYYEANGWKVGKNPMKDWKACIRTWESNNYNNNNQQAKTNNLAYDPNADYSKDGGFYD